MSADWRFLVTLNEQLRPLRDPIEMQELALRLIAAHLRAELVSYGVMDGDDFALRRSYAHGGRRGADRLVVVGFGQAIVEACRRGETVRVNDVHSDSRITDDERRELLANETVAFVAAPLIKDDRWLATLCIYSATPRTWTGDQVALVEMAAERTWAADAEETQAWSAKRKAFLRRLNETVRPLGDPACILVQTCRLLGEFLQVNRVAYGEIDGDDCVIVGEYVNGLPHQPHRFPWGNLGASRTAEILRGGTLTVNDTSTEPHTAEERAALQAAGIGAYICPLLVKDGRFVGSFGIHSRLPRVWTPDEIALVDEVADRIWTTLEHHKAEAELRANEERLAFLLQLNDAIRPLSDPSAVQETAARLLGEHLEVARVGYTELNSGEYTVRREHTRGVEPLVGPPLRISVGARLREALRRGETVVVNDVEADERLGDDDRETLRSRQIAAFVGVALFKDQQIVAAFGANHNTPRVWSRDEIELVRDVAERTWEAVERTRAEVELREQKERIGGALEASAGGSWTWVAATNQVDWDDRFRALYGFTRDEPATPEKWLPRVYHEDRPKVQAVLEQMLTSKTKDSWESTFRIERPDGTVGWIQSRGRAERDADGNLMRLTGLDLDFNQHRRTEEALQRRRDEQHDRALRTLLETATQGIVSVDAQGTIVSANRALEVMFGWAPGELIGQSIERLLPDAFGAAHAQHRTAYFAAPGPRLMGGGLQLVGQRKDQSTFPIEVSLNHVDEPGGGRAFAFVTDITERQRAATALQERTTELEYRTTQLRQMASDLTLAEQRAREQIARTLHDGLQQLLLISALNLEQQLTRDREAGAVPNELLSEAKHHLDEAVAAARSLSVDLFPPVLQRSGLAAALKWLANWTQDKYKIEVQISVEPGADSARKDVRTLLFESTRELLLNAVKHARADRIRLELALTDDDQLCITVTDQGIGFDRAALDDRSRSGQMGWGLFSIRERLTLLGGRFDIDSAPGCGTQVRLVAPRGETQGPATEANGSRLAPIRLELAVDEGRTSDDALRILIVDDHAKIRSAVREILQERPQLSVVGDASNGFEAIAYARTLRPDVILMDVAMPHMDGIEATAYIHAELPDIQILGLSMQPRSDTVHAIERAGAAGFFVKGTDTQKLIDHLLAFHASRVIANGADS